MKFLPKIPSLAFFMEVGLVIILWAIVFHVFPQVKVWEKIKPFGTPSA